MQPVASPGEDVVHGRGRELVPLRVGPRVVRALGDNHLRGEAGVVRVVQRRPVVGVRVALEHALAALEVPLPEERLWRALAGKGREVRAEPVDDIRG